MKRLILLLFLGLSVLIYSRGRYGAHYGLEDRYIYADIVNVRQKPNLNAEIIDKIKAGHEIVTINK